MDGRQEGDRGHGKRVSELDCLGLTKVESIAPKSTFGAVFGIKP